MDRIAVFANDIPHAREVLEPLLAEAGPTHWIVVACPPTLTRHIGRWASNQARAQWRERWAADLYAALEPLLTAQPGSQVERLMARRPLADVCDRLQARHEGLRVLDARRPKPGRHDEPLEASRPTEARPRWTSPLAWSSGVTLALALAD